MLSLKEATEQIGKTKATLLKAINSGKVSAQKDNLGRWEIDPAELFRVYDQVTTNQVVQVNDSNHLKTDIDTQITIAKLQFELEHKEKLLQDKSKQLDEWKTLHKKADNERFEAQERLNNLLENNRQQKTMKYWFKRIIG